MSSQNITSTSRWIYPWIVKFGTLKYYAHQIDFVYIWKSNTSSNTVIALYINIVIYCSLWNTFLIHSMEHQEMLHHNLTFTKFLSSNCQNIFANSWCKAVAILNLYLWLRSDPFPGTYFCSMIYLKKLLMKTELLSLSDWSSNLQH